MALARWNPWTTLPTLQDRINRVFDDMFPLFLRQSIG